MMVRNLSKIFSNNVVELTILLVHAVDFSRVSAEPDNIMVELRDVRRSRQLRAGNAAQRVQRRYVVKSLEELVHQPEAEQTQHAARAQV